MVNLTPLVADEIFSLNKEFIHDPRKEKINGGIGIIVGDDGLPFVLPVVNKAIKQMKFDNFNYLPVSGDISFLEKSAALVLGSHLYEQFGNHFAKQGVVGGTNGLNILGSLLTEYNRHPTIILSNPTWENHKKIFSYLQFNITEYTHVDENSNFNFASLVASLKKHPSAYVLLHGGPTHNPTGVNPNNDQWSQLIPYLQKGHHHVIFDFAYMGIGDDIEKDSYAIRLFLKRRIPFSVVVSFSKNMTLYQHRTGALFSFCQTTSQKEITEQHLQKIFRIVNSNPPAFGEQVAKIILEDDVLKKEWIRELAKTAKSIKSRRQLFVKLAGNRFSHILQEKGLFSLLYLEKKQIVQLRERFGIFLLSNSRINFGGFPLSKVSYLSEAISKICP